ncbi:GTPase-activating protein CdGAPr isoform X2 [Spodoptera frugiperda]|uniref:GTPase-activating protein CdGAPr isoform X2 n=1 Tax=Spodoptera frugiperda TaxID=7108 RepID=A0A9R0E210_SPOFR|nr:GTPase-activating protein CdGAPr isoform X2 [Spodoptera frugiperda]
MRRVFGVCTDSWMLCGQNGSPHGSVMSCQSLAARAFAEPEKDMTHCSGFHRSVRFSSDSRSSTRANDAENKRETPGSISLTALTVTPVTSQGSAMSQSLPSASVNYDDEDTPAPPLPSCRFPKLEECAHFHYERVSLGGLSIETVKCEEKCQDSLDEGWICLKVRSHVNSSESESPRALSSSWTEASAVRQWTLTRNRDNLLQLDDMLHRCIYDRKVSGLPNLREKISSSLTQSEGEYQRLIADYVHHLSIIADDSINCGPVLNWLQMDNKGHKLLVANEDSSSINTPAVAAAYSVRKYVSQARDEISFEVGDMISIIDMPGPAESLWWRGKRGFRVGFFPHHCVAVIGDKVPRHMTQPPPIVGSVAVAPIKPVLRKHGKLISLFRSFILSRPSRRSLKQQGILRERVFGCDLGEHLLNCGHDVPQVLVECARAIEARGAVDGVYRLSGGAGLTQRLRAAFDAGAPPDLSAPPTTRDPHAVPSLLKMYFRELPNPLCTYQLYESFVSAVQAPDEAARLRAVRDTVVKLPPPHYRTLAYLMRHLRRVSLLGAQTGMTARNMAIVWAPNLLRAPRPQHALQGVAVQAVVTEFLICYAEELFAQEQGEESGPESLEQDRCESEIELRGNDSCRRPKSLPINPPTKLLSLEEARRRGQAGGAPGSPGSPRLPPSGAIAAAAATQLRPSGHLRPNYIEVGSGPNNLPQYHTVLDLPAPGKRGLKRSPSGWRGLFVRHKTRVRHVPRAPPPPAPPLDVPMCSQPALGLRPVKSCESLTSDTDTLAPLAERAAAPLKHHTRSSSCDSYFEPWQAELADMRLRLSPQERDHHMFSEEDDTQLQINHAQDSLCSTPPESGLCSAENSPRRNLRVDIHQANELAERRRVALEEQLSQIGYIDGESPRARPAPEKRHSARPASPTHTDIAKRLCKDRDSPMASLTDFPTSLANVKLRERNSPRKSKARYSGMHFDTDKQTNRLSWHGKDGHSTFTKDGHSTLIKIDWPAENSVSNLTTSTINSSPLTPITPIYDPLESDSEVSEANKHTIQIKSEICDSCEQEKCLKCELKATDYENIKDFSENLHDSLEHSPHSTDISYHNLNRLSAVSNSSNSDHTDKKKDESDVMKVMTSSHESSSSYSNVSLTKGDELYECYNYTRPNYINLQSSSTSKSSPGSPLKSPLKSTISITFRSPTKNKGFEDTPTNDRDSVYEDIDLEKNLSIVEDASVPQTDACLPTQQACQPNDIQDLIILETPTETNLDEDLDVYSQVKFFKKSIDEVNAMLLPEDRHYENIAFEKQKDYENINVDTLKICDKDVSDVDNTKPVENGNFKTMNVRELAIRFESPTEQKSAFTFEKFKAEIKYPSLERKDEKKVIEIKKIDLKTASEQPQSYKLSKNSCNARSLDENAFVKEFGNDQTNDRRKSLEVKTSKKLPDLNLNTDIEHKVIITPTTENKISLIQRFDRPDVKNIISFDCDKKLSRERIEKYKEERRNFLREKYSSQSFRSNPEQLTRIKIRKDKEDKIETCERLKEEPKFERRNTVDLGQRLRFSLAKSSTNLESIPSPTSPVDEREFKSEKDDRSQYERKEKMSPSYNIRDMTAIFEQKAHPHSG